MRRLVLLLSLFASPLSAQSPCELNTYRGQVWMWNYTHHTNISYWIRPVGADGKRYDWALEYLHHNHYFHWTNSVGGSMEISFGTGVGSEAGVQKRAILHPGHWYEFRSSACGRFVDIYEVD